MSVNSIDSFVLLFPNEEWANNSINDALLDTSVAQLRPNISFAQHLVDNLQTLSTHNADATGVISGFLYVPDLIADDPCVNISKQYIPFNVTRRANLAPTDFTLVALAPWISIECTKSYLAAARLDPARAFIFYQPDNSTSQPPPVSSAIWGLDDGGSWKSQNQYPVYAVPGSIGGQMMYESSLYSGNMTNVPFGHQIAELPGIDPRGYVRIYTEIGTTNSSTLPTLWAFLLIVIAVLAVMLATTSAMMHIIQRSRRQSLRRRVASGEVNLEALGIKRLTVPQEFIDRLPLFTYNCEDDKLPPASLEFKKNGNTLIVEQDESNEGPSPSSNVISQSQDQVSDSQERPVPRLSTIDDNTSNPDSLLAHKFLPYSQPTCPICLDDFEAGTTPIRELPCGHIFHPECIDYFLINNSSLCPICKKMVLPIGYCPVEITNAMVRRERNVRNLRSRITIHDDDGDLAANNTRNRFLNLRSNLQRAVLSASRAPRQDPNHDMPLEPQPALMTNAIADIPGVSVLGNEVPDDLSPGLTRREFARQRIEELAAGQGPILDPDVINQRQRPKWRRTLAKVFPGFS